MGGWHVLLGIEMGWHMLGLWAMLLLGGGIVAPPNGGIFSLLLLLLMLLIVGQSNWWIGVGVGHPDPFTGHAQKQHLAFGFVSKDLRR